MVIRMVFPASFPVVWCPECLGEEPGAEEASMGVRKGMGKLMAKNVSKGSVFTAKAIPHLGKREAGNANLSTPSIVLVAVGRSERGKLDSHIPDGLS